MLQDIDALKVRISRMMSDLEAWEFEMHKAQVVPWNERDVTEFQSFWKSAERSRRDRLRKARSPSHEQVFSVLDELCDQYLTVTSEDRVAIRKLFGGDMLWALLDYAVSASDHIASSDDSIWLNRGLAALSIADNRHDFRDVYHSLGELYIVSARVGIDPKPFLQGVGRKSSTNPGQGQWTARDHFMNFEQTKFFEVDVKPHLPKSSSSL